MTTEKRSGMVLVKMKLREKMKEKLRGKLERKMDKVKSQN